MSFSQQAPLDVFASVVVKRCALVVDNETRIRDKGWEFVEEKTYKLDLLDHANSIQTALTLTFPQHASCFDIFHEVFLSDLASQVSEKQMNEYLDNRSKKAGNGHSTKLVLTICLV